MSRTADVNTNRRRTAGWIALILLLALLAVALWYASNRLARPLSADRAAGTEGFTYLFSVYGYGSDRLHRPAETAVDGDGNVYVTDSFKHRVVVFDSDGAYIRTVGGPAKVEGGLKYPAGVEVDGRGRVYVASTEANRVVIYDRDGTLLRVANVKDPLTLAIAGQRLYVATSQGILIGDLDGSQIGQLSGFGRKPGRINRPTGLSVDEAGNVYIADSLNYRFQAIDKSGKPLWSVGKPPSPKTAVTDRSRTYGLPVSLTLASDGLLYGLDAFNGQVLVFNKEGEQVGEYGSVGRQDGEFYYPSGIAQVSGERFVIADTYNDRLQYVNIPSASPDLATRGRRAFPWIVPLLILLAILPILRRPVVLVADAAGLRRAANAGVLGDLAQMRSMIHAPDGTYDAALDVFERHPELTDRLQQYGMDTETATGDPAVELALALRGRLGLRRAALVCPDAGQGEAAEQFGIGVLEADLPGASSVPAT